MAQLPCEHLKRIGTQTIFVVDQGVVSWSTGTLDTLSGIEIEVISVSQNNIGINDCTSWNVLWFSNSVSFIFSKKPSVVHLVDRNNCETRSENIYLVHAYYMQQVILEKNLLVFPWKLLEGILNCSNFNFCNSLDLTLRSTKSVNNDLCRFDLKKNVNLQWPQTKYYLGTTIECFETLNHDVFHVSNNAKAFRLGFSDAAVFGCSRITWKCSWYNRWHIASRACMTDGQSNNHDRLTEDFPELILG